MKRLIAMIECAVIAGMLVCVSPLVDEAGAQWQVPADSVPIGRGAGTGFRDGGSRMKFVNTPCNGTADDTAAIQAAINALPVDGGRIMLPTGVCLVSSTITIGDGSTSGASTRNGVVIEGVSQGISDAEIGRDGSVLIRWTGASGGTVFTIAGPIWGVRIDGITIDCATLCNTGFNVVHPIYSEFTNLQVIRFRGKAYIHTAYDSPVAVAVGSSGNLWSNFAAIDPVYGTGAIGMQIGASTYGLSPNLDVAQNTYQNCRLYGDGTASPGAGLQIGFADVLTFSNCTITYQTGGAAVGAGVYGLRIVPPTGGENFPGGLSFFGGNIASVNAPASWTANSCCGILFMPFHVGDSETPPAGVLPGQFYGVTEEGRSFGGFASASGQTSIASATSVDIWASTYQVQTITGTTTIQFFTPAGTFSTVATTAGECRTVIFQGSLTLTASASLILPGGVNIQTQANDRARVCYQGSGVASVDFFPYSGTLVAAKQTNVNNADYTILPTDHTVAVNAAQTLPRTYTLPLAASVNPGQRITILDKAGGISSTNTLTIARAGTDTINGATSIVLNYAFAGITLESAGSTIWNVVVDPVAIGGTGRSTLTANAFLTGNGTSGINQVAITGLVLGNGASAPTAYAGTSCTNQFPRSLDLNGAATCASVAIGSDVSGLGTGVATFLGTPSSANLASAVTDETGSGALVFGTLPTISSIILSSGLIYPTADSTTAIRILKADGTTAFVTFDSTNKRVGINKTPSAFDLDVAGAINSGAAISSGGNFVATAVAPKLILSDTGTGTSTLDFFQNTATFAYQFGNASGVFFAYENLNGGHYIWKYGVSGARLDLIPDAGQTLTILGNATVSATKTVRDSAGTGTCTLIFTQGILTGGTC